MKIFSLFTKRTDSSRLSEQVARERLQLLHYACSLLGNKDDAEDAVQDLFIRLCSRPTGEPPRNIQQYLYRSLHNLCTDRLRRHSLQTLPIEQQPELCDDLPTDREQELQRIPLLLSVLPPEQAEVIRLRFYGEKSFQEISLLMNIPLSTVKSRFRYGMEKLRNRMYRHPLTPNT